LPIKQINVTKLWDIEIVILEKTALLFKGILPEIDQEEVLLKKEMEVCLY
jgi:hypothetical protein